MTQGTFPKALGPLQRSPDWVADREMQRSWQQIAAWLGLLGRDILVRLEEAGDEGLDEQTLFYDLLVAACDSILDLPDKRLYDVFYKDEREATLARLDRCGWVRNVNGRWTSTGEGEMFDPAAVPVNRNHWMPLEDESDTPSPEDA